MKKTRKFLVTGATGFIGSHLVEALLKEKGGVRCLVLKNDLTLGKINDQRAKYLESLGAEIFYGNLLEKESLRGVVNGISTIFHLGAIARPMAIPDEVYFKINVEGTKNLLEVCRSKRIKKFIYMSSISAIGPSRDGKPVNESTPCKPIEVYGESKLEAEKILFDCYKKYKIPIVILRPPMVFGERDFEMLRFFKAIKYRFFPLRGKGKMEFCYVKNLVQACLLAEKEAKIGEIYCVSNGGSYTLNKIIKTMASEMQIKLLPISLPVEIIRATGLGMETLGKIFHFHPLFSKETAIWMTTNYWCCDISKAKKQLGYKPEYSLQEGIRNTIRWYQEKGLMKNGI